MVLLRDDYDYEGGGGRGNDINAPAEIRPAYNDAQNTGELEVDPFAPFSGNSLNDNTHPKVPSTISAAATAAATATVGINLDDPMAYLNDPVLGDAVYHAEKVSQKTRSETAMSNAIQNAQGLMTSLDGEDDAFHATVRAQIAAFTANADAFLASSRMQRRIEGWQKRILQSPAAPPAELLPTKSRRTSEPPAAPPYPEPPTSRFESFWRKDQATLRREARKAFPASADSNELMFPHTQRKIRK